MAYLGDFAEDETTIEIWFTTHDKSGGAIAPSTSIDLADFKIYKDGGVSQKTATDGLTVSSPFDSLVGLHLLVLDTSNDTNDSGFWVTGSDYIVVLDPSDETVDGETVIAVIGQFSIENRFGVAVINDWTNGGRLDTLLDAIPTTAMRGTDNVVLAGPTEAQMNARTIAAAAYFDPANDDVAVVTLVDTTTTNTDMVGAAPTAAQNRAEMDNNSAKLAALITVTDATVLTRATIETVTNQTNFIIPASADATDDNAYNGAIAVFIDGTDPNQKSFRGVTDYDAGTRTVTVDSAPDFVVTTSDTITILTMTSGVDVASILVDTDTTIPALLPTALAGGLMRSDMVAVSGDATAADRLESMMDGVLVFQVNAGTPTTTAFIVDGDVDDATNDHYNGRLITWLTGALAGQQTDVTDWDGGTRILTVTALTEPPANNDTGIMH